MSTSRLPVRDQNWRINLKLGAERVGERKTSPRLSLTLALDLLAYYQMKMKNFALLAVIVLTTFGTGCYSTLDGRVNGGVPWAKDKIESRYERTTEQLFAAAKAVLSFNGALEGENTITRTLWAKVNTRTVWVIVDEIDPKVSQVTVQARTKGGSSDIDLASEMDKQIALRLAKP